MTPAQFLARMKRGEVAPAYLFAGTEAYQRKRAREALLKAALGQADRDNALVQYDLSETALAEVIDDARALSLFAAERVIFAGNAEAALPRARADEEAEEGEGPGGSADALAAYLKNPTPGVVLVFDAARAACMASPPEGPTCISSPRLMASTITPGSWRMFDAASVCPTRRDEGSTWICAISRSTPSFTVALSMKSSTCGRRNDCATRWPAKT